MKILEMLSMLNPKCSDMEAIGFSTAAKSTKLTSSDIALLFTGVIPFHNTLLMGKYAGDESCIGAATEVFEIHAKHEKRIERWLECDECGDNRRATRLAHYKKLCRFTADRFFEDRICPTCRGTGYISQAQQEKHKCTNAKCQNGRFIYTPSLIARMTGIPRTTINDYQDTILKFLWAEMLSQELEAIDMIRRNKERVIGDGEIVGAVG